ncbi:MAG TPA: acyltransferase [Vicinamibacterales bacterium]|nr:acyltransferase [Vicinamibacterales bacterium]
MTTRSASLDVLRAVAITLVIGRHMSPPAPGMFWPGLDGIMRAWFRGGWVGVDLFFVLSGFLVSGLLFREYRETRRVNVGRFLIRRGLKIYPAFYVLLGVGLALETRFPTGWLNLGTPNAISEALFVQNYGPSVFGHTWSLAVEEHFYLLCALLIYWLSRRAGADPYRALPAIVIGVAVASVAARIATALVAPYTNRALLYPTHLRLDGLMFGVGLAYLFHFRRDVLERTVGRRRGLMIALGVALLLPAFVFDLDRTFLIYTLGLTAFYVGSGLLVVAFTLRELPAASYAVRALAFIGAGSYSIYLWHTIVRAYLEQGLHSFTLAWPLTAFAIYFAASVAVGTLMAKLIELPVLKIRDRLLPR